MYQGLEESKQKYTVDEESTQACMYSTIMRSRDSQYSETSAQKRVKIGWYANLKIIGNYGLRHHHHHPNRELDVLIC